MARVFTNQRVFLTPVVGPIERLTYRVLRVRPERGPGLEGLRPQPDRLLAALLARALPDPPHPGHPAVQPARASTPAPGTSASTPPPPSSPTPTGSTTAARRRSPTSPRWPGWRCRTSSRPRSGSPSLVALIRGIVARSGRGARQLLAGPGPDPPLHPAADLDRRRPLPRLPGRDPEPRRLRSVVHTLAGGTQILAQGPVASQEAIKELGTNGGGFFNVNSRLSRSRTRAASPTSSSCC